MSRGTAGCSAPGWGRWQWRSAITLMQKARQTLAVVVDRQGRAIGLVTMKDLVEELVGDLENW